MLDSLGGALVYVGIAVAAAVEGEVAYSLAAALVGQGHLNALGVVLAGTAGACLGDQFYFYLLRGRLRHWLDRYERIARRGRLLAGHVRRHAVPMVFMIRFAPGLRIAMAAACAYAGVGAFTFSVVNLAASAVWAVGVIALVAWFGPAYLSRLGISGWWSALVPALVIVVAFRVVGRLERHVIVDDPVPDGR
jgi:membrane protein DedA with SNARE-associated domain